MVGKGERSQGLSFSGYRITIWDDEKFLEMGNEDGCTTIQINIMPPNCILKVVKMVTFVM